MDESDFDDIMDLQRTLAQEAAQEQETDNKIELMSLINELTDAKNMVQKEKVIIEARHKSISEETTLELIEKLKSDNFLVEKGGYLKTL